MTTDLEQAVSALSPAARELMARAFLDTASRYVARGESAHAQLYTATAGLLLAGDLGRAAQALGRRNRHQVARTMTTARDRRMGGPSGWPELGDLAEDDVAAAGFFHELAVAILEVGDAEDAVVQFAAAQLDDTPPA